MNADFSFEPNRNLIIINQSNYEKFCMYMSWARENNDLYYVFNSGVLMYKNAAARDWFLLKWN